MAAGNVEARKVEAGRMATAPGKSSRRSGTVLLVALIAYPQSAGSGG